jgi:hypothetical protein
MSDWLIFEDIPNEAIGFTYIIVNEITGRSYIGLKTLNSKSKWQEYYGTCTDLKNDITKFGKENFTRGIIRFLYNKENLLQHEINLQTEFNVLKETFVDGTRMFYNRSISNIKFTNVDPSDEVREKIRKARAKQIFTEETRKKLGAAARGKKLPKVSEAVKKRYEDPKERKKTGEAISKALDNPESKKKKSDILLNRHQDNLEYHQKALETLSSYSKDPEVRKRRSEQSRKRWADPEYKEKIGKKVSETKQQLKKNKLLLALNSSLTV